MPDDLQGWEDSREKLSKEILNGGLCDQYQDNFFIDKVRSLMVRAL